MKTTRLLLLRHGEVKNAAERLFNGHTDVDLSDHGVRQYETIAAKLKKVTIRAVYSSDLRRAARGAALIAKQHSLPVTEYRELRELNYGVWEGKRVEEVMTLDRAEMTRRYEDLLHHRIKGGETLIEMRDRVIRRARELLKKHLGETIVMVAHGGVNRILLLHALNCELGNFYRIRQEYGAFNIINYYENGGMDVELMGVLPPTHPEAP